MKKSKHFTTIFLALLFTSSFVIATEKTPVKGEITMPENIKVIIDKSCFGCHNTDSRNEDAKKDLDFKTLNGLSKVQQIGALRHIGEVIEKKEMPPKQFLERFPDRALSEEESNLLAEWVKKEAAALLEE